ncbi:hypothetical protein [Streptomyces sp. SCL15-6]|uniref:hypothetical protein n=1 Tax=Streptomyces sp. SCL15-6 TaxID=2967222 RepID=UPI002966E8BD|nr:hypothetical protein [Streptomyces sp. SCL15-6]
MTGTLAFDGLAVPLQALRLLAVDFPHLPAPDIDLTRIYPDRLTLCFHDGLGVFEAWREALGVPPEAVTHTVQSGGSTHVLRASTVYAGATLHLRGYADVEPDGGAA